MHVFVTRGFSALPRTTFMCKLSPLSANPTKWSNTLKQFVGKLPMNCLSVFDQFVILALKVLDFFSTDPLSLKTKIKSCFTMRLSQNIVTSLVTMLRMS